MAGLGNKKRNELLETGKQLFLKHGVKRISVEEICSVANVSKATFYKYFKNKDELLRTIRDNLMDIGFSKFDEINKLELRYSQKVNLMSKWRIEFFKSIQGEFLDEIIEKSEFKREYLTRFIQNIKIAQENGEIRKEVSPELIALVTEKLREITLQENWKDIYNDYATYQDEMRTLLFFGMLTDENRNEGDVK
ncbi:MAG: TetR/AcrR family transcriptional regulator [Anaerolineaceae bacterium]|nr:TetR/AcrR family transcriptional regulator [Anaerolineaceae bacterium]